MILRTFPQQPHFWIKTCIKAPVVQLEMLFAGPSSSPRQLKPPLKPRKELKDHNNIRTLPTQLTAYHPQAKQVRINGEPRPIDGLTSQLFRQANKKLLASTEFVRNGGKFDYGKFDKMIEGPKESSDEENEYEYVSNDDAGFPVTPKNAYLPLSIASKYPCREDVRQWEKSFECLLNNKFGCALFRHILRKEFSDETNDFFIDCEEFRKMRKGKRSTKQKAIEIYSEFVAEHSPKEVNLDSDTRAATLAAVEGDASRTPSTWLRTASNSLCRRTRTDGCFLRDRLFLDLLESNDNKGIRSKIDLSLSTSSLYPSQEDVWQWEKSFECLLKNIYGCALFRHFLKKEHSHKNMTFWLECEGVQENEGRKEVGNPEGHRNLQRVCCRTLAKGGINLNY
ncbi:hypothetical protein CAEBREN_09269 [Caenorhabditis brenneri]|uniref:RGS domain-containing protein n=1 Tax=Caenorhabditis brenneri TaxID=135651 RepID=G0P2T6_CAEBE|nr:hypothetical protein CAEBREN_09269 [Caenorhabditis brenneri]